MLVAPPNGAQTIVALASGAPPAGVAVIRIAGPAAFPATAALLRGPLPAPRYASLRRLHHPATGKLLDTGLVLTFPSPASFTGDDTAELHVHGGSAVIEGVLAALTHHPDVRHAKAGEFSRRAFDNGRLDLTQVEALADLIEAETEAQRDQALDIAGGSLRRRIEGWREILLDLLAEIEAELDFSDAEDDVASHLHQDDTRLTLLIADMRAALDGYDAAREIREGLRIAIIGPPNAGKSSLFNALLDRDAAIVTPIPGTTRDTLEARIRLGPTFATLIDTAGLRETTDPIEAEGITRAQAAARTADLVLSLDDTTPTPNTWVIASKVDVSTASPQADFSVSAVTGAGISVLKAAIASFAAARLSVLPALVIQSHHAAAVARSADVLGWMSREPLLRAEACRLVLHILGSLTGDAVPEVVLGRIFGRFCVGK